MKSDSQDGISRRDFLRQVAAGAAAAAIANAASPHPAGGAAGGSRRGGAGSRSAAPLPTGVRAVWDLSKAHVDATPTRARVCVNGLWRWQPAAPGADAVPTSAWGYFKVPGSWPGITDYMQKDCQTVYADPAWRDARLDELTAAWYERDIEIPKDWAGRRIALRAEYVNSFATVFIDGRKVGEIRFPAGEVDLSSACQPGGRHVLSILVVAMPLRGVMLSYSDTASAKEVRGAVARRGLCGDVYLIGEPAAARLRDVKVDTSVRQWKITVEAGLDNLDPRAAYALCARVSENGRPVLEFTGPTFAAAHLVDGRIAFSQSWKPDRLWDIHTPGNTYDLTVSLLDATGRALDTALPVRFGFREFWIDGRDFYLNGTRIFLSAVPLDNAQIGAHLASYGPARESLSRLQSFGINFVYTHNYGCEPGSHLSFEEILRAADDVGMLVALSQPHFGHYDWEAPDADQNNGYARHAEFYVRVAQNHPSVVAYSMSHNATGYTEDMNPDMIDGIAVDRDQWSLRNAERALRAEAIVKRLDPARIVYHHSSGNLSSMHTSNFYPNFVPIQEMSDWFEHWSQVGRKPVFTVEYGAPFTWDWAMYRGWYRGERTFGSAVVPWEFCQAEWSAQFLGDRAFRITEMEKTNLRWEAAQFRAGKLWHRWDYPHQLGSPVFDDPHEIIGRYITDNWRAFRTWGMSANSPWEYGHFWRLRDGVQRRRVDLPVDWDALQRPGFSADYIDEQYERMDLAFEPSDWEATPDAQALLRNNLPLLAYLAGKPARFTNKDHNFRPGDTVEKQLVLINNSRLPVTADWEWSVNLPERPADQGRVTIPPGDQRRLPISVSLPPALSPGAYEISATVRFGTGEVQTDSFSLHVMPPAPARAPRARIAVFDPRGETVALLRRVGVSCDLVSADADPSGWDLLVIGKGALTVDGPGPDLSRVPEGLKVLVFEQTSQALERRLGFRVTEYGLRQVFPRVPGHPLLAGLDVETLRDWRGEATLLPPRLTYKKDPELFNGAPTVKWCDIDVTRLWRCGCRGNVASVLIEKPAGGDFLPIVDGGYNLQYSPLLEHRAGRGLVLLCQMDVTGRTEDDPAADMLVHSLLSYAAAWKPQPRREVRYLGDPAGLRHLEAAGISAAAYEGADLPADCLLVVGPGGAAPLAARRGEIASWLSAGGRVLCIGLDEIEANSFLPFHVRLRKAEHICTPFDSSPAGSPLAGIGAAETLNRDPREVFLVSEGARTVGGGVLAHNDEGNVVFCALAPWEFDWRKPPLSPEAPRPMNLKRTFRRTSVLLARLLGNLGAASSTPLLRRFAAPAAPSERRWLEGLYLDEPEEWDDPYRFFRW